MLRRLVGWRALLCCVFFCLSVSARADEPLLKDFAVLADDQGQETILTASFPENAARYLPLKGTMFSGGYTRDVHWFRFTVQPSAAGEWWLEVGPPLIDDLRLYQPGSNGFTERRSGDVLPFSVREEQYRSFVFKLNIPDSAPRTYYLRLQTSGASIADFHLWQPDEFRRAKLLEYAGLGFYLGLTSVFVMVNLLLWRGMHDTLFGWLALYTIASLLLTLSSSGLLAQYLFAERPSLNNITTGLALFILFPAGAPFWRRMVRVEPEDGWLYQLFRLMIGVPVVLSLSLAFDLYTEAAQLIITIWLGYCLLMLFLSWRLWCCGTAEGLYLLLGITFALIAAIISSLAILGFNPADVMPYNVRPIAVLASAIILELALVIRVRNLSSERQNAIERAHQFETEIVRQREANAEQGRFIAMLSHEVKTPLAVIDSATQSLERIDSGLNTEVSRRHDRIRGAVRRIDRLVDQFLKTDAVDDGGSLRRTRIDVMRLLQMVAETSPCPPERLSLKAPEALVIHADNGLLRIAVANLVDNGLKYSPADAMVFLSAGPASMAGEAGVEILVSDRGPGVPQALREQIFSRYVRGQNVGNIAGAGLGLYLVRRIAELHGGRVDLMTSARGATFRLWLPAGDDQ